ncbi:hypothetical protein [uncultured Tateyamaria sp.]|uniref:hypothetical protein n=1 Tax=uncultured Tateyamaria sp. TaxID=455651 RepID=UPI002635BDDD|nr:hypothetical protein [uncultured Tateyamaria sp.]
MHWKDLPIQRFMRDKSRSEFKWLSTLVERFHSPYEHEALTPETRTAISDQAAIMAGSTRDDVGEVPEDIKRYVKKVALYAYRILDKDMEKLMAGGRSDEEIYEATLAAILGSNLGRLERGLALVEGDTELVARMDAQNKTIVT